METTEKHSITLVNRRILTMGGVDDIAGFDEDMVILDTSMGRITVEGKGMKIESLTKEGGNILITGDISGIYCSDTPVKKKGLFERWFG